MRRRFDEMHHDLLYSASLWQSPGQLFLRAAAAEGAAMTRRPTETTEDRPRRRRRRAVTAAEIIDFLEYLAPPSLSLPESPSGLQAGSPSGQIRTIVVAPMASFHALSTAAAHKNTLLVTAAPLLTSPIMSVRRDDPVGGKLAYLLEHQINLYVLPNAFASAPGGFDDSLAEVLGLAATSPILPTAYEPQYKMAVYVPHGYVDAVHSAASEAGAGGVGNYSHCSFQVEGTGTFFPRDGARPAIGQVGRLERVAETRLELLVPQRELQGVIAAVLEAHPYEEVAYDVYVVKNPGVVYGRGRIAELPLQVALETVLAQVQDALGVSSLRCSHMPDFPIGRVAVASGVSDGIFWQANKAGAGALVTGGASQYDLMLADGSTTVVVDVGYGPSVAPGLRRLCAQLHGTFSADGLKTTYAASPNNQA